MLQTLCINTISCYEDLIKHALDSKLADPLKSRIVDNATHRGVNVAHLVDQLKLPGDSWRSLSSHSHSLQLLRCLDLSLSKRVVQGDVRRSPRRPPVPLRSLALPCLRLLNVSRNPDARLLLRKLCVSSTLRHIDASYTDITDSDVAFALQSSLILSELNVSHCAAVGDRAFTRGLRSISLLLRLDVSSTTVGDRALMRIADCCPILLDLVLDDLAHIAGPGVVSVLNSCHSLSRLSMASCESLDELSFLLVRNVKCQVKHLDLQMTTNFSEPVLQFLFGCVFKDLLSLNLSAIKPSLSVLKYVLDRNPRLSSLSLRGHLVSLTDQHLMNMECLSQLRVLDLCMARALSSSVLERIIRGCAPILEEVSLVGVTAVSQSVLEAIALSNANLRKVNLGGCRKVVSLAPLIGTRSLCMLGIKGTSLTGPTGTKQILRLLSDNLNLSTITLSGLRCADSRVIRALAPLEHLQEVYVSGVAAQRSSFQFLSNYNPRVAIYGH